MKTEIFIVSIIDRVLSGACILQDNLYSKNLTIQTFKDLQKCAFAISIFNLIKVLELDIFKF